MLDFVAVRATYILFQLTKLVRSSLTDLASLGFRILSFNLDHAYGDIIDIIVSLKMMLLSYHDFKENIHTSSDVSNFQVPV